jgi:hypothetical protein
VAQLEESPLIWIKTDSSTVSKAACRRRRPHGLWLDAVLCNGLPQSLDLGLASRVVQMNAFAPLIEVVQALHGFHLPQFVPRENATALLVLRCFLLALCLLFALYQDVSFGVEQLQKAIEAALRG